MILGQSAATAGVLLPLGDDLPDGVLALWRDKGAPLDGDGLRVVQLSRHELAVAFRGAQLRETLERPTYVTSASVLRRFSRGVLGRPRTPRRVSLSWLPRTTWMRRWWPSFGQSWWPVLRWQAARRPATRRSSPGRWESRSRSDSAKRCWEFRRGKKSSSTEPSAEC